MERLFVYGSLKDPAVQQRIFGREVAGTPDALAGYTLSQIWSSDNVYPIIIPGGTETISGLVLEITPEEMERGDAYETDDYRRVTVTLQSGTEAWVYCK